MFRSISELIKNPISCIAIPIKYEYYDCCIIVVSNSLLMQCGTDQGWPQRGWSTLRMGLAQVASKIRAFRQFYISMMQSVKGVLKDFKRNEVRS